MLVNYMMTDTPQLISDDLLDGIEVTYDHLLTEQVQITQPKTGYRVGSDAVFAAASLTAARGRVLDLGAGVGGISLCIAKRLGGIQITAVEIDSVTAALARHNVVVNRMGKRVFVVKADITAMPAVMANRFDHVISNPPYHHKAGTRPRHASRAKAHMGADTDLHDWVKAALWAAKPRGRISFICRADRVTELIGLFDRAGAGEALLFPLWSRPMSPAHRVIIQVRKAVRGPGAILAGLIVHNEDGSFTEAAQHILRGGGLHMVHPAREK
jgi:tRNA1Val (adenine37-N6)-methyltransferase